MSPYYQNLRRVCGRDLLLMPSVAALIHDVEGRLLLIQKHDGSWSLPAGAIEPGETPELAVRREVEEETGFICHGVQLAACLGGRDYRHTYSNGDQVEYLIAVFRCQAASGGPPTDLAETRRLKFFAREEMPRLALPYEIGLLFGN